MKSNKKILIFAILIGLITVFGVRQYINKMTNVEETQIPYSQVVVALNNIPANVKVTPEMVTIKSMPTESIHPEAIIAVDKVIGGTSNTEIVKGEQILSSRVVTDSGKASLAYRVPENMRAISMPSSEVSGVAGFINVGDKIDILAFYDKKEVNPVPTIYTQLQNIEVVAVGSSKLTGEEKEKTLPASITVLVNPAQAEVLVFAISNGTLYVTLRNPVDSGKVDLKLYNSTNFSTYKER